jgi:carboxymethylenebutenolidase
LAPNLYHPLPENIGPDSATGDMKKAYAERALDFMQIFQAAADYLNAAEFVRAGKLGIIGFCLGGRLAMLFAAREKRIRAVVAFHPGEMKPEEITDLKVPVQFHHGTGDRAISHTRTLALAKRLRAQSTPVEVFLYEKLDHGFLAYTRPHYDADEAKLAWSRTVEFLTEQLMK